MTSERQIAAFDRYTTIGELTTNVRRMIKRTRIWLPTLLAGISLYEFFVGAPGLSTLTLLSAGTLLALFTWTKSGRGLPLMPTLAFQHFIAYGLPIIFKHPSIVSSSPDILFAAGLELAVFLATLVAGWRIGMEVIRPSLPFAYVLVGIDREGIPGLRRIGFLLIGISTLWLLLQSLEITTFIYEVLPNGTWPIIGAAVSATSACGFFLIALIVGSNGANRTHKILFWSLLTLNCLISASGFLLSGATTTVIAAMIGIFWATGRTPWRFIWCCIAVISFLNLGKFTMREQYWRTDDDEPQIQVHRFNDIPHRYLEWSIASYDALVGAELPIDRAWDLAKTKPKEGQSLLERVNNLSNLLYVIEAVKYNHIPVLNGATYTLIPPLLLPRIIWPNKPRSHQGQVLLNMHFGRQDLEATFQTYIAWGLLPEAYGNFGPFAGSIFLGLVLGWFCAWIENVTVRKPVLSAEGFVAFVIFLAMASSYEMVASVLITSVFQSIIPVVAACAPFVQRKKMTREPAPA